MSSYVDPERMPATGSGASGSGASGSAASGWGASGSAAAGSAGWVVPGAGPGSHVPERLSRMSAALAEIASGSLSTANGEQLREVVALVGKLEAQLTALAAVCAREVDRRDLPAGDGSRNSGSWWARETIRTRREAHRLTRLADALETCPATARALGEGAVLAEQATVITAAVTALPADVGPEVRAKAETALLEAAVDHDADRLRILGRRILDLVAPEIGEAHERKVLEAEETRAWAQASFTMTEDGTGRCHGRFTLPTAHGQALRKHLLAIANPQRHPGDLDKTRRSERGDEERGTLAQRLGRALCEYVETYPADGLPHAGGVNATVVVTITLEHLITGLGSAALDTGGVITAGEARRLACEAGIVPAVLGGHSEILDLGRTKRLHTTAQRHALALRDGGCTADGCGLPPSACHAHHHHPWATGGTTNLSNGRLLCPRHHRLAHNPRYNTTTTPPANSPSTDAPKPDSVLSTRSRKANLRPGRRPPTAPGACEAPGRSGRRS